MNALVQNQSVNFLTPTNLNEAMQIADLLAGSDIVPKDYQRKPGNILVAMQWGAEIGLQPLQAMQNIAVINGRPSIWGDAMLALVRSSGLLEFIREEISEDGQKATVTVKRKGEEEFTSTFTMEDAKKAGLSGKQGPWSQYPKRMLKLRARSYALRDVFPDVLKGMAIAEEERDKEVDVTPATVAAETSEVKANSGTSALKSRLAKNKESVESTAKEIDLNPYYARINDAQSLGDLAEVAADIKKLGLGDPAKSELNTAYKAKHVELSQPQKFPNESVGAIINELENSGDLEALNTILASRFEPYTGHMTQEQVDSINAVYERKEAELTA
ncbi:recombinase RecT [Acinetobacter ursingii]|uniref:recombinase RecT n=1 Tax=Acinetobacter ursingii TaxID=108980 RepID=UPI00124D0951|nr:recombinase RecT [Acinetobacter ursingii]